MRAGATARSWTHGTGHVELENSKPGDGVRNKFSIDSKGGGTTEIQYTYGAKDYKSHLQMMIRNDRTVAMLAMADTLQEELRASAEREAKIRKAAQDEIVEAAEERWRHADGTDEAIAKIVQDGVESIVAEIRKPKKS